MFVTLISLSRLPRLVNSSPEIRSTVATHCATHLGVPLVPMVSTFSISSGSACYKANAGCADKLRKDTAVRKMFISVVRHRRVLNRISFNSFDLEVALHGLFSAKLSFLGVHKAVHENAMEKPAGRIQTSLSKWPIV